MSNFDPARSTPEAATGRSPAACRRARPAASDAPRIDEQFGSPCCGLLLSPMARSDSSARSRSTNAPIVSVRDKRNHEHHVASVIPVTGRAPRDVRERHHLDRGGGSCSRSESGGRLRSVSAAIVTPCCRSIRATRTSSGRSCFCAVGPSEPPRRDRELLGPSEAWRWRLNTSPPPGTNPNGRAARPVAVRGARRVKTD